jgi:hypothetical protein
MKVMKKSKEMNVEMLIGQTIENVKIFKPDPDVSLIRFRLLKKK